MSIEGQRKKPETGPPSLASLREVSGWLSFVVITLGLRNLEAPVLHRSCLALCWVSHEKGLGAVFMVSTSQLFISSSSFPVAYD